MMLTSKALLKTTSIALSAAILSACSTSHSHSHDSEHMMSKPGMVKTYDLITNDRSKLGTVELSETADAVTAHVRLAGIAPGEHGIHFHAVADCSDDKFLNTKAHINPLGMKHGLEHPEGPDNADLPNLIVDANGVGNQVFVTPRLSFHGAGDHRPAIYDADGSALVIHANADDQNTQPIGGAGGRLVCAELK